MNRFTLESAVDRLIALASDDEKPAKPEPVSEVKEEPAPAEPAPLETIPEFAETGELPMPPLTLEELEQNSVWKALLQLRTLVPYVARVFELSTQMTGHAQPNNTTALSNELKQVVGDLHTSHHDLRLAVQDQTVQMKRLEEEMTRSREATERNAYELGEMAEDIKSMHTLAKRTTILLGSLLIVLIGLVVFLVIRLPHLIH